MKLGSMLVPREILMATAVLIGCVGLSGCDDKPSEKGGHVGGAPQSVQSKPVQDQKVVNDAVLREIDNQNKPQSVSFENPGIGDAREYLDMKAPLTAFNLYNAKRDWNESAEDLADSVGDAFTARKANPELARLGTERLSSTDNFKKKDLAVKVNALAMDEASKLKDKSLVKFSSDEWTPIGLTGYDFDKKGFAIDSCLFSDKLSYTDEESRNSNTLAQAPKLRCYVNPGPVSYYIGFTGGSQVFFEIKDESKARQIESARQSVRVEIYGYVKSVERERLGGNFGVQRWVLISPQRVDVIDIASGAVLLTKTI